jgi:hypothetical protein
VPAGVFAGDGASGGVRVEREYSVGCVAAVAEDRNCEDRGRIGENRTLKGSSACRNVRD